MAITDYWEAAKAAASAFRANLEINRRAGQEAEAQVKGWEARDAAMIKKDLELNRQARLEAEDHVSRWEKRVDERIGLTPSHHEKNSERSTREVIDPINGKEYTVNVEPYSWGYKYEVRDSENGEVLRSSDMKPNLDVAMEDAQHWIEHRHNEIHPGGFAKDGRWVDGRDDDDMEL